MQQNLPSQDFNRYVNGKWMDENPIPEKYSKSTFEILHEENLNRLKSIINDISNDDIKFSKLRKLYDSI